MEIYVSNVNQAFSEIFWKLKYEQNIGPHMTRNGPAFVFPAPVTTVYHYPAERVLFHEGRDANPIFHLMESIWMLAGRRDVAFLKQFNSTIGRFSDDGSVFNAAYGYRWRHHFGFDQLITLIETIKSDPGSRQAVLQMWDPSDLVRVTKDKACNMSAVFEVRDNKLNMTVFNRSNDIWWGAYGANAVHFSFLQEFVAAATGYRLGVYRQVSNNLHLYEKLYAATQYIDCPPNAAEYDHYARGTVEPLPLDLGPGYLSFLSDCELFCENPYGPQQRYGSSFFQNVAVPMANISRVRRHKVGTGVAYAESIVASDWRLACQNWISRREQATLAP